MRISLYYIGEEKAADSQRIRKIFHHQPPCLLRRIAQATTRPVITLNHTGVVMTQDVEDVASGACLLYINRIIPITPSVLYSSTFSLKNKKYATSSTSSCRRIQHYQVLVIDMRMQKRMNTTAFACTENAASTSGFRPNTVIITPMTRIHASARTPGQASMHKIPAKPLHPLHPFRP